jgi:hypothetical protein
MLCSGRRLCDPGDPLPAEGCDRRPGEEFSDIEPVGSESEYEYINYQGYIFMSGPIVRRYGFPNFEKIFGERPIEHGVEEPESAESRPGDASSTESKPQPEPSKKPDEPGGSKAS